MAWLGWELSRIHNTPISLPPTHLPTPLSWLILYLPHPPITMDYPQISTDFPTMCFFIFGLLTEVEEELIKRIAIILRRASFPFSWSVVFWCFFDFNNNENALSGEETAASNRKQHTEGFSSFPRTSHRYRWIIHAQSINTYRLSQYVERVLWYVGHLLNTHWTRFNIFWSSWTSVIAHGESSGWLGAAPGY